MGAFRTKKMLDDDDDDGIPLKIFHCE